MLEIRQFPCLNDNYGFLIHDPETGQTAAIDTPDGPEILKQAEIAGWRISAIWNTHWHPDHTGGNAEIKAATGCEIIGPTAEADRIPELDRAVTGGDKVALGATAADVLDVGGHTLGHIAYHLPSDAIAFVGDSLFALGCGRLFEGTPEQMWASLLRLRALPAETTLYCAHEYTQANARFAETVDPENAALRSYIGYIDAQRTINQPTVPMLLSRERATNPFLRADDPALQAAHGAPGDAVATFAAIREMKDRFKG
ncbi:MAG: hydroxyacylglutathione hydrolase [Pseudomonadota bacterium]